ncbi:hypothetical protein THAOC_26893, partial [Thalassiosira oceanica]
EGRVQHGDVGPQGGARAVLRAGRRQGRRVGERRGVHEGVLRRDEVRLRRVAVERRARLLLREGHARLPGGHGGPRQVRAVRGAEEADGREDVHGQAQQALEHGDAGDGLREQSRIHEGSQERET